MLLVMTVQAFNDAYIKDVQKRMKPYIYSYDSMLQSDIIDEYLGIFPYNQNIQCMMPNDDRDFDIRYAEYLMQPTIFEQIVKMMILVHNGTDVIILVKPEQESFSKQVLESFMKFIQQRYGVCAQYVYSIDDLDWNREQSFSINGLYFYDYDVKQILPSLYKDALSQYQLVKNVFEESETHI